jgi:hypothetical protein
MLKFHEWSLYIIQKCAFLSGLFLSAALVLSIWADATPSLSITLRHYIQFSQSSSAMVLAAGLLGGLLLEEGLRRSLQ